MTALKKIGLEGLEERASRLLSGTESECPGKDEGG